MFRYNYQIGPVNPEKNIYSLRPTSGALAKAFLPSLIIGGGLMAYGFYLQKKEDQQFEASLQSLIEEEV